MVYKNLYVALAEELALGTEDLVEAGPLDGA
jgi:hypothetical protein